MRGAHALVEPALRASRALQPRDAAPHPRDTSASAAARRTGAVGGLIYASIGRLAGGRALSLTFARARLRRPAACRPIALQSARCSSSRQCEQSFEYVHEFYFYEYEYLGSASGALVGIRYQYYYTILFMCVWLCIAVASPFSVGTEDVGLSMGIPVVPMLLVHNNADEAFPPPPPYEPPAQPIELQHSTTSHIATPPTSTAPLPFLQTHLISVAPTSTSTSVTPDEHSIRLVLLFLKRTTFQLYFFY